MAKVTIVSITYNQSQFISQAIESFLSQKTDFAFKVIICDDCSTDGTDEIVLDYQRRYPDIIRAVCREKNLGPQGNGIGALALVDTEYAIICEGDDYFLGEDKLQKQVDFLERNPDFSICFHPARVVYEDNSQPDSLFPTPEQRFNKTTLTLEDLLLHNFIQTNTAMYRWRFAGEERIEDVFPHSILPLDYYVHLLHAQKGKVGFIEGDMAVYRRWSGGIWWQTAKNMELHHIKNGLSEIRWYISVANHIAPDKDQFLSRNAFSPVENILSIYWRNGRLFSWLKSVFMLYKSGCGVVASMSLKHNLTAEALRRNLLFVRIKKKKYIFLGMDLLRVFGK